MPSFRAYLTSWVIWAMYYRRKRASEQQLLLDVQNKWRSEYDKEAVPAIVSAAITVKEETFQGKGPGGQKWKVFHCAQNADTASEGGSKGKVVVYWHGGAFINGAAPQHWAFIQRIVTDQYTPVVFPQYTRAPEGTADGWCVNALQFTLSVAGDPRYANKTIIHMGDSAGGWMSLRIRQLLCGIILGEEAGFEGMKDEAERLIGRTGASILISPVVNFEMSERLIQKDQLDPWLSIELLKAIRRLWFRGPASVPEIDYDLPANHSPYLNPASQDDSDKLYAGPTYSLNNGLDVFTRYHAKYPAAPKIHLLTMIGTYDLCHVGCEDMQKRLEKLGEVFESEYIEEEGLNHVYAILSMPEADKAWAKIGEVLRE